MINRVILVGNLTQDAEAIATTGKSMTKLRIATNHYWRDASGEAHNSSEFHSVVCFGRQAEACAQYCCKGHRVYVEGRLRTREYEASNGARRLTTEIVADIVKMLQSRGDKASAAEQPTPGLTTASQLSPTDQDNSSRR